MKDSNEYFLINLLSGNADVLTAEEAALFENGMPSDPGPYIEKGYIVDEKEEEKNFKSRYLDFIDKRENDEVQLFYVTNYTCNFNCSYCYQSDYPREAVPAAREVMDVFFRHIDSRFGDARTYITLFGGEPLLPGRQSKENIHYMLQKAAERGLDIAVVTNGYNLVEYAAILKTGRIREVQVTLDGTAEVHNSRRPLKNGSGTFGRIVEGIDHLLFREKIPVNLRVVVDKDNIENLPELARFAIDRGWTSSEIFKTQLGRNYELHYCQKDSDRLYSRLSLYEKIYGMLKEHPHIVEFHKPSFSIAKFLLENGKLPDPLYDSCPGCKREWAFDCRGDIYPCTATVGKPGESVGKFYPETVLNEDVISEWQNRDVLSIKECSQCSLRLACGGGCASVAKNANGKILSPDCRPVRELLELGMNCYFKDEPR
ncbi:MAG: radical SAM protein [Spirochaetales bacterium]|nr:radical SAM protein [Spirochaetales bacterium]